MLIIDNDLKLNREYTFEEFQKSSYYTGAYDERNGAYFVLGGVGSHHTIRGMKGPYCIGLVFQDTLQCVSIVKPVADSFEDMMNYDMKRIHEDVCEELKHLNLEAQTILVCGDPHWKNDFRVIITYKPYDASFYKKHDIWKDG